MKKPVSTKPHINPFRVGTEIRDPADFVGRRKILRAISGKMIRLQSVSLHGERRTGKTSLLLYLAHPDTRSVTGLPSTHIPVYFDFQGVAQASSVGVWQAIVDTIADQIKQRLPNGQVEAERFLTTVVRRSEVPGLFVTGLQEALAHLDRSGFKFHLLFDEFERTADNPHLGDRFYDALRSLPTRTKNVSYVIATRTGLAELQLKSGSYKKISSPFFNIFTTLTLRPFQGDEVIRLILDYLDRSGTDFFLAERLRAQLLFLYEVTGYHPFFLQTLCYHLYERLDQPDWPQVRQEALADFERDSEPHFEYYWDVSSEEEQLLVEKLATRQSIDWDQRENMVLVESLKGRCLTVRAEFGWRLFSSSFARWVEERQLAIWYTEGVKQMAAGMLQQARTNLSRILELRPGYRDVDVRLGEVDRLLELDTLYYKALECEVAGDWAEAQSLLIQILKMEPHYKDASLRLEKVQKWLRVQALYNEGIEALRRKDFKKAIERFDRVLDIDLTHQQAKASLEEAKGQLKGLRLPRWEEQGFAVWWKSLSDQVRTVYVGLLAVLIMIICGGVLFTGIPNQVIEHMLFGPSPTHTMATVSSTTATATVTPSPTPMYTPEPILTSVLPSLIFTPSPSPTGTPIAIFIPSPTLADTPTATSTPTDTPAATFTPSLTPTDTPMPTATTNTAATRQAIAATAIANAAATQQAIAATVTAEAVMRPVLLEPEDGALFTLVDQIYFKWSWYKDLEEKEHFSVRLWHKESPNEKHSLTWVKTTDYILDLKNPPIHDIDFTEGYYYWNVAVVLQTGPDPGHNPDDWKLIAESKPVELYIINVPPAPTPTLTVKPTPLPP